MDEQAKRILYEQLVKIRETSNINSEKLIEWNHFTKLDAKEVLKYSLLYRNRILEKSKIIKKRKKEVNRNEFYLELPDMDLSGQDLSDVYLNMFMPGYAKEENGYKKVFVTTNINLKDTKCVINLASIRPIIISEDGVHIKEITADIKKCDFRGCIVFGKFQNSKAKLEYNEDNLPKEYIERLSKYQVPYDARITTDIVYLDMIERKIVKGTNGLQKVKQIVDFDLTGMRNYIWKYRNVIKENNIDISYTGAFIYEYGLESIGKENYYIDLEKRAREAYLDGNMKFVEEVFIELDKETKRKLVTLALRDGNIEFAKKHQKELSNLHKRYMDIKDVDIKLTEADTNIRELLKNEYKEGKMMQLGVDLMYADIHLRSDIIEEIYENGDLKFAEKYLDEINTRLKNKILEEEFKKGNEELAYRNFDKLSEGELKKYIIKKEWENRNVDFFCDNYEHIKSEDMREKIHTLAFKNEKVKFLSKYIDDLPRNMQVEAVIKFKDLDISEDKMRELMN